jgi:hypothetical protein
LSSTWQLVTIAVEFCAEQKSLKGATTTMYELTHSLFAALLILANVAIAAPMQASHVLSGQGPPSSGELIKDPAPKCIDMKDAQVPGLPQGSACRVRIQPISGAAATYSATTFYRSGWTHQFSSESDSDLTEDSIRVEGYLYHIVNGTLYFDPPACIDSKQGSMHAACRTYGGSGSYERLQNGHHYFYTAGYGSDNFSTQDHWTS